MTEQFLRALTIWLAGVLIVLIATQATAVDLNYQFSEETLHDRGGRKGFKVGRFRISPQIYVEGRYDSNVFYQHASEGRIQAGVLRILPGLKIVNPDYNKIKLEFEGEADILLYFSDNASAKKHKTAGGAARLNVVFLPKSIVSITVADVFKRGIEVQNQPGTSTLSRLYNKAGVSFGFQPGGRQLQISAGYNFGLDFFDNFQDGDRLFHEARLTFLWRFFPKTALIIDGTYTYTSYRTNYQTDSMPVRALAGVKGLFSKKLAAELLVGYGNSLHKAGPKFNMFIGRASVSFYFIRNLELTVGGGYDFAESLYGNFYDFPYGYLQFRMRFFNRLHARLELRYAYLRYAQFNPTLVDSTITTTHLRRRDHTVTGKLEVDYDILSWLGLTVGYQIYFDQTDYQATVTGTTGSSTDIGGYIKHEVYLSINFKY